MLLLRMSGTTTKSAVFERSNVVGWAWSVPVKPKAIKKKVRSRFMRQRVAVGGLLNHDLLLDDLAFQACAVEGLKCEGVDPRIIVGFDDEGDGEPAVAGRFVPRVAVDATVIEQGDLSGGIVHEIGRASCRERGEMWVVGGSV